jgi:hypothetical protein
VFAALLMGVHNAKSEGPRSEEFSCGRQFAGEASAVARARLAIRRRYARPSTSQRLESVTAKAAYGLFKPWAAPRRAKAAWRELISVAGLAAHR